MWVDMQEQLQLVQIGSETILFIEVVDLKASIDFDLSKYVKRPCILCMPCILYEDSYNGFQNTTISYLNDNLKSYLWDKILSQFQQSVHSKRHLVHSKHGFKWLCMLLANSAFDTRFSSFMGQVHWPYTGLECQVKHLSSFFFSLKTYIFKSFRPMWKPRIN